MQKLLLFILAVALSTQPFAQSVGVGTASPHPSAQLDISSADKGFLPPRMTTAQRKAIASPAAGLIVFDSDFSQLFLFDGVEWQPLSTGSSGNTVTPSHQTQPFSELQTAGLFGMEVDLSDDYAVVGAPTAANASNVKTGAVYVYKRSAAGTWSQVAKLYASDGVATAYFGASVSIADNYIVIGAPRMTVSGLGAAGKVYVFVKGAGDTWAEQTSFTRPGGPVTGEDFGFNVAITTTSAFGPAIVASAPYYNASGNNRGAAYVYRYSNGTWISQGLIGFGFADFDYLGWDVDIDGDYCVVGDPYYEIPNSGKSNTGSVLIFFYNGSTWGLQQQLNHSTAEGAFGLSLSIKGSLLAAAAPYASPAADFTGSVYVYTRTGTSWGNTRELYLSHIPGFDVLSRFGMGLSIDTDKLLIGMPCGTIEHNGAGVGISGRTAYAFIYQRNAAGEYLLAKTIQDNEPFPFNGNTHFGSSVAIRDNHYIIGCPGKTVNLVRSAGSIAFGYAE